MQSVAKRSSGAMEEDSGGFKSEHALLATACQNSAKCQSSTGRWKKAPEVQNASAHVFCLVAEEIAVAKVRMAVNVGPAALYAKVCNQSRNVPAGRWKKAPEGSNASTNVALRVKAAQSVKIQRGDERRVQRVQMRAGIPRHV